MQDADFIEENEPSLFKSKWVKFFVKTALFIASVIADTPNKTELSERMKHNSRLRRVRSKR